MVFNSSCWSDEKDVGILILEMNISKQSNIKIHYGPKIFAKKPCEEFLNKHGKKQLLHIK